MHYFVGRFAAKIGRKISRVPKAAMQRLTAYAWPGNVRELENVIERAVILSAGEELDVPAELLPTPSPTPMATEAPRASEGSGESMAPADRVRLEEVERCHIVTILKQTKGRIDGPQARRGSWT